MKGWSHRNNLTAVGGWGSESTAAIATATAEAIAIRGWYLQGMVWVWVLVGARGSGRLGQTLQNTGRLMQVCVCLCVTGSCLWHGGDVSKRNTLP